MDNQNNCVINGDQVEEILNYFGNVGNDGEKLCVTKNALEHFRKAFVHESYHQSVQSLLSNFDTRTKLYIDYIPTESSERLEYLGDHILKAVMGRYLYERFPCEREGFLTRLKIKIEKCSMLHKIGVELGFKKFLLLSLQVENQTILDMDRGRNTPSYYEDAFEAFIGAIVVVFGETGYLYADRFVRNVIENVIDFSDLISNNDNFKDSLQRFYQSLKWNTPTYTALHEDGPLYRKVFTRAIILEPEHYNTLSIGVQRRIKDFTNEFLQHYKLTNKEVYNKLFKYKSLDKYILGIGCGRKVVSAEQDCAKVSLKNLQLSLNY